MYFAPISQATKYNYLDDKFQAAYKWLAETDLDNTPAGSYPICEGVTANVQEYTTFPASEGSFETHDKFFDIQYVISGKEQFGVCTREGLILKEDHPENDLKFYNAQLQHVAEPGEFNVQIGLDSQNVEQNSFQLQ